jgi:uncharacterized membrane protein YedE/YeeE
MVMTVVSGLLIGIAAGVVLQRGRFCMNSAFRDTIFIQDYTFLKAAMIALLVAMVGANFLEDIGQIQTLRRQVFAPVGNILGGYLFGIGIVIAGGCGSGIWFRVGEGLVSAFFSVLGFMIAILASQVGILSPLVNALRSYRVGLDDDGKFVTGGDITEQLSLFNVFGVHDVFGIPMKWIVIAILAAIALPFIFKEKFARPKKGFPPHVTGLLMGLVIVAAWWASEIWGGGARGVSYTGPTAELFRSILNANLIPDALYSEEVVDLLSEQSISLPEKQWPPTWSAFLVLGTPIGAYLSARSLKEFKWVVPDAQTMVKVFLGGLLMGFGAVLGGGCNVGHSLTGLSTLAMSSAVATIFIILGNWTMVYFLFIKPMQDLE